MISIFDLYKIGIGPSSSHTVGPMKAANLFLEKLLTNNQLASVTKVHCELFGSLGATGKGHGSDIAVMLGLMGETPEETDTKRVNQRIEEIRKRKQLHLNQQYWIDFSEPEDLILHKKKFLPYHPNSMTLTAYQGQDLLEEATYYSVGGGFVLNDDEAKRSDEPIVENRVMVPYPFNSANELLVHCDAHDLRICEVVMANEKTFHDETFIYAQLDRIWDVMQECVINGCEQAGILPGGMKVKRRAYDLHQQLLREKDSVNEMIALYEMDWVNLYALAVNEENAAGGRVVTAPTNGAAGIIPAVLHYYRDFAITYDKKEIYNFMLTSAAIGIIIKQNASISGAEVGCQGEVGSACAMAAAGLTEAFHGSPHQCTNAAEIGIEHNLGLTCDPIGGLVQVPCIERNAMAAVKAINASRIARRGDGTHFVSLDKAIKTMKDTGKDMMDKYKETARGGLAINVIEVPVNFIDC
ncbi:MAG: L-serine ammonia-lyase [Gammaproteobacteria bacterium]|nr:MAG: L-serine ammonia-lyase [Gammaproteobacteria bacterium]